MSEPGSGLSVAGFSTCVRDVGEVGAWESPVFLGVRSVCGGQPVRLRGVSLYVRHVSSTACVLLSVCGVGRPLGGSVRECLVCVRVFLCGTRGV